MSLMKSGEFAKLCNTTKNTLIHYDQIDLLRPSTVGENGYRYYDLHDYWRFRAIGVFVQAGFKLDEVKRLLADRDEAELLNAIASTRTALEERMAQLEHALAELDGMAQTLNEASRFDGGIPMVVHEPKRLVLVCGSADDIEPSPDFDYGVISRIPDGTLDLVEANEPRASVVPYGFTASFNGGVVQYEEIVFLLPYRKRVVKGREVEIKVLDEGDFVSISYAGPWEQISEAYENLATFAKAHDLSIDSPFYEVSRFWPFDEDEDEYRCRIFARVL